MKTLMNPISLEIARRATLLPIPQVAEQMGIRSDLLEPRDQHAAKISLEAVDELKDRPAAKYVVVWAVTPTPLGEGKATTTIGLGQAFKHVGKRAIIAIRQASMGSTFGIKGGAAGGGYSQRRDGTTIYHRIVDASLGHLCTLVGCSLRERGRALAAS